MNLARKFIFLVLLAISFAPIRPVWSQEATNHVKSAVEIAREDARQQRAKAPIAKGTLEAIDLLRRQVKLQTEDGLRTFTYTTRTYIFRDKEKITADKLKVGEVVAVRFAPDADGNVVVQRLKVRTPSALMEPPSLESTVTTNSSPARP